MPDDTPQVNWQTDPDFHNLPLAEKHKVLLQVDPDYKGLPPKEQDKALDAIHYGSLGKISGDGISLKGAGSEFWNKLKSIVPEGPDTSSLSGFLFGRPRFDPASGGIAQAGREAAYEYQRSTRAGSNPLAAAGSAAVVGAGSLGTGLSNIEQEQLAEKGEGGKIVGQAAVPAAMATLPLASEVAKAVPGKLATGLRTEGGAGPIKPSVRTTAKIAGMGLGHLTGVPGLGELGGYVVGPEAAEMLIPKRLATLPPEFPGAALPSTEEFYANRGAELEAIRKMNEQLATKAARKSGMKPPPPNPFATTATSTNAPIGNASLPEVLQSTPTPFPTVQPKPKASVAVTGAEPAGPTGTSLLSRGRTLVTPGLEPDLNNPVHVKMINDYQTMSGPALRQLASAGDRFAAFVLRHMPRPQ